MPFCGTQAESAGVWYTFTGTGDLITLSLCDGTDYDSKLHVFTGSCGNFTCVAGNDDFCGTQSLVSFASQPDTLYYVYVNGFNVNVGNFTMVVSCDTPQVNDLVCGALPLAFGTNGPYNFITATAQPGEPAPEGLDCETDWCNSDITNTLWFTFQAPASGNVSVQTPDFDTQLAIWQADSCQAVTSGGAVLVAANDDDPEFTEHGGVNFSSYVELTCLTPGQTYFVQVDVFSTFFDPTFNPMETDIIVTDLGDLSLDAGFTGLEPAICVSAAALTLVPNVTGGTFSGTGVTSDGIFDPAVAGIGGPYAVIYNLNECTADTQFVTVTQLEIVADVVQPSCVAGSTGSILLTVNGVPPYSFNWSNFSADQDLIDVEPGTYSVTVSDATGCSGVDTFTLTAGGIQVLADVMDVQGCGAQNGAIYLTIIGGTDPVTVTWSNGSNADTLDNLAGGVYDVTVSDASGCSVVNSFIVSEPAPIDVMITEESAVFCVSDSTGSLSAMPMSGDAPFTYLWSNNATDAMITGLAAGTYSVTVTDVNGCSAVTEFTLNSQSPEIVLSETHTNAGCGVTGSIDLTVTGGVEPFTFAWSNLAGTEDLMDLDAGTYVVTVTDANGCSLTSTVEITGGSGDLGVELTPLGPVTSCHMAYNVMLEATMLDNVMYIFTRDMTDWVQYNDGNVYQPNTAGTHDYAVIAIDTLTGCVDTSNAVSVTLETLPTPAIGQGECIDQTVELTASPSLPSYSFQWLLNGADITGANASTYTATQSGSYRVRITDSCGVSRVSDAANIDAACFTGFEEIALNKSGAGLSVYPNPNDGHFAIETYVYLGGNENVQMQVVNMLGQVVFTQQLQLVAGYAKADIAIDRVLADGVYSVRVLSKQGTAAVNIVVTRP